ncbi:hypothetical protein [Luteimonas mephitis]|uniref:hypothetical protein n=1 Tax=Luteimonas mephitis TaxID=83615 RepID=UPI00047914B7|nr:hypothetical protein [Luteimonas mephitis]
MTDPQPFSDMDRKARIQSVDGWTFFYDFEPKIALVVPPAGVKETSGLFRKVKGKKCYGERMPFVQFLAYLDATRRRFDPRELASWVAAVMAAEITEIQLYAAQIRTNSAGGA